MLNLADNVRLRNTRLENGRVVLGTGSRLDGAYRQEDGVLELAGGDAEGAKGTFSDGKIAASATNVTLKNSTLTQGKIILRAGSNMHGTYKQTGGLLTLGGGDASAAAMTLSGGGIAATAPSTLANARIISGAPVTATGGANAILAVNAARINGGLLVTGEYTEITGASIRDSGLLSIQSGVRLGGDTTLTGADGIGFSAPGPGNTAVIENLKGNGGVLHFTVDMDGGKTDHYTAEASEGEHLLTVAATGTGEVELLLDVQGGAGYSLSSGSTFEEEDADTLEVKLTSLSDGKGGLKWLLSRASLGRISSVGRDVGNVPAVALAQAMTGMGEMSRHFRNLRDAERAEMDVLTLVEPPWNRGVSSPDPVPLFDIWANSYARVMTVETLGEASMEVSGLDIGFDKRFASLAGGALHAGIAMGGQWLSKLETKQPFAKSGTGSGRTFSVGAYGLWLDDDGWYANAGAGHFWIGMDASSYDSAGQVFGYSPKRTAFAVSAEAGRRIPFGMLREWYVEPGASLTGVWMGEDSLLTSAGQSVSYGGTNALQATAGMAVGYAGSRARPYLEAALVHGFGGKTSVVMEGTRMTGDSSGTRVRAGLGASIDLADGVTVSASAAYEYGARYRELNGSLGIDFSW